MSESTNRRDDDTTPLGDELFGAGPVDAPGADGTTDAAGKAEADADATVPLTSGPAPTERLTVEPPSPEQSRAGDTSVLDVPASPAATAAPPTGGPGPVAVPSSSHAPADQAVPPNAAQTPGEPSPAPRRGPRVSTIVWGFVIVAFGVVVLAAALGARVDLGLAAIVVLAAAGVTLVVGSIVSGARRRRG